jgi:hypothetical protein
MSEKLELRIARRISRSRRDVFLRADFGDLGGYDQVGRTLGKLVRQGKLLRISHGLYSRAVKSRINDRLIPPKGLSTLRAGLERLGIETLPGKAVQDYNAGRTTQVPTGRVVAVRRRVRRKIGYNGFFLTFERDGFSTR